MLRIDGPRRCMRGTHTLINNGVNGFNGLNFNNDSNNGQERKKASLWASLRDRFLLRSTAAAQPLAKKRVRPADELNRLISNPGLYDPVRRPRNPVVLCHGLYGFDVRSTGPLQVHYWGDLVRILRGIVGAEVYMTSVPGTASIEERAHEMDGALRQITNLKNADLNFIGHSMGGLDCRYLMSQIRPTAYRPRSLVSLSTPHRGSEFMAWCRENVGLGTTKLSYQKRVVKRVEAELKDLPYSLGGPLFSSGGRLSKYVLQLLDTPAYYNLTPEYMRNVFNPQTPDVPGVHYYSVAATVDRIPIWHPLWLPKLVMDGVHGPGSNDGLVTVQSATWGEFLGTMDNCDHWQLRGSSNLTGSAGMAELYQSIGRGLEGGKRAATADGKGSVEQVAEADAAKAPAATQAARRAEADQRSIESTAKWIIKQLPLLSRTVSEPEPAKGPPAPGALTGKERLERMTLAICRKLYDEGL